MDMTEGAIRSAAMVAQRREGYWQQSASIEAALGSSREEQEEQEHRTLSLRTHGSRPAVMPYARALVGHDKQPFTREMLAAQVQVVAGMGAEGVILWGASEDYHDGTPGCAAIEQAITSFGGAAIASCLRNRTQCAEQHCSGHGRCVDFLEQLPQQLDSICTSTSASTKARRLRPGTEAAMQCRCEPGFMTPGCRQQLQ